MKKMAQNVFFFCFFLIALGIVFWHFYQNQPQQAIPLDPAKLKTLILTNRIVNLMNSSFNPCSQFFEYACSSYEGYSGLLSGNLYFGNLMTISKQFENEVYMNQSKLPLPVKKACELFKKCVKAKRNMEGNGEFVKQKIQTLEELLGGVHFPILQQLPLRHPDSKTFAAVLSFLMREKCPTFVTAKFQSQNAAQQPYILTFDQATLTHKENHYTRNWQPNELLKNIVETIKKYVKDNVNEVELNEICMELMELEFEIGANLNTIGPLRRNASRMFNVFNTSEANFISPHLNFELLIQNYVPRGMDMKRVEMFVVMEPQALAKIMAFIFDSKKVKARTLLNYFFYRLLYANIDYLPKKEHSNVTTWRMPEKWACAEENAQLFPWANGRVFLDAKLPSKKERHKLLRQIRAIIADIMDEFLEILPNLEWTGNKWTKAAAFRKIVKMKINVGWPELVENDKMLTEYYADLEWNEAMSYAEMVDSLNKHQNRKELEKLFTANETDRSFFWESPSQANAWIRFDLNSMTLPLGILDTFFFDPNIPAPFLYGGIGFIIGHEIAHLFDDQGIQIDKNGALANWMDSEDQKNFRKMADSVVEEYGKFEPVNGLRIDGSMTQGENIADKIGLLAAFKAFRKELDFNGQNSHLPEEVLKIFTHDQLFFLTFAQLWCFPPFERNLTETLLGDPHPPGKYRILGSIQKFPAFHAAFNCSV